MRVRGTTAFTAALLAAAVVAAGCSKVDAQRTSRGSQGKSTSGNGEVHAAMIAAKGAYLVYDSTSSNVVAGDTVPAKYKDDVRCAPSCSDVFLRERTIGRTLLVSRNAAGVQANGPSSDPAVSANGGDVAFSSNATNLDPADTDDNPDVYVKNMGSGRVTLASVSMSNQHGDQFSSAPVLSANGRYVAFASAADDLVPGDTNHALDVFVRDLVAKRTERVSVSSTGAQADAGASVGESGGHGQYLSADGRYVVFESAATNLVAEPLPTCAAGGTCPQVYLRDRLLKRTTVVSRGNTGPAVIGTSPVISGDGNVVAWMASKDYAPGDANNAPDVYVRDLKAGKTTRASVPSDGALGLDKQCCITPSTVRTYAPELSDDGSIVSFTSRRTNLVPSDVSNIAQVYVRDRVKGLTTMASVSSTGAPGDHDSFWSSLAGSGDTVAFVSLADNLVAGDTNTTYDAFVRHAHQNSLNG